VRGDRGDIVRFEVSGTRVGIDNDQAAHLFDAFVQADQSTTRRCGGTGLGLTISRELAHHMGGEIGAEVGDSVGSVFWFTVKLPAVAASEDRVRPRPALFGLRALVVEESDANRTTFDRLAQLRATADEARRALRERWDASLVG